MIPSASGYLHTRINYDVLTYLPSDIETNEPAKIAKIYVTVYYAEKVEQKLHHFKKSMDIGNGYGGIVSQLQYDNEMKLTDEYWINYQKGKGSEEFQKYMEDLTDMQNHVLPYLQSFCNLEEKGRHRLQRRGGSSRRPYCSRNGGRRPGARFCGDGARERPRAARAPWR